MDIDRGVLLALIALLLFLSWGLVRPYLQYVLAAILLAFVLHPLHLRLAPRVGETWSAAALVLASFVAIVAPIVLVLLYVAGDAVAWAQDLQEQEFQFDEVEEAIADYTGREVDVQAAIQDSGTDFVEGVFGGPMGVFETLTHMLLGIGLLLFLLFFFIKNGDSFVVWLRSVSPLPDGVTDDLLTRLHDVTRAVLAGHLLVAIVQGVLAGIGLFFVGIPNAIFWTFVMVILALIPIIGTFAVWGPAAVFLFLEGQTMAAVALTLYGTIVVGVSDDYLRPVIVDRYAKVSPSAILVGVLGGISSMGFMGLFVGPIVVAALKETIEVYAANYGREANATS